MKIRSGFVSNSSSSSFVLIGVEMAEDDLLETFGWKKDEPNFDENNMEYDETWYFLDEKMEKLKLFYSTEENLVGHIVAQGDETDFGGDDISIPNVVKIAKEVSEKLNVPVEEIKLMSGIRAC